MKTFVADIIPKILKFSQKLDNLTILTNQHWVEFNNDDSVKTVWIFRSNNVLLITNNGIVEKSKWEFLDCNSLLIETSNNTLLLKHGFLDDFILALKLDGQNEFIFFINESKSNSDLNSLDKILNFLKKRYLNGFAGFNNKNCLNYKSPEYRVIKSYKSYSLMNGNYEVVEIQYLDGISGEICIKEKSGNSFFKTCGFLSSFHYLYLDFESCVNGYHYYFTNNKVLNDYLLEQYS